MLRVHSLILFFIVSTAQNLGAQNSLMFTLEQTYVSGAGLSASQNFTPEDVMIVEPDIFDSYHQAWKFATEKGWQTLMGDADGDSFAR